MRAPLARWLRSPVPVWVSLVATVVAVITALLAT